MIMILYLYSKYNTGLVL